MKSVGKKQYKNTSVKDRSFTLIASEKIERSGSVELNTVSLQMITRLMRMVRKVRTLRAFVCRKHFQ